MATKTILITGANGQLGHEMRNLIEADGSCRGIFTDRDELDITDARAVDAFFDAHREVDYLVNCAAFTAVDKAEDEPELCRRLNTEAAGLLARAAEAHGAKVVHISTDYVFSGTACAPYREDDATSPQSVYGSTKLDGERALLEAAPGSIIIRTAWLYSPYGHNFVKTMLDLGRTRKALRVVCDQVGTPTYALDLARAIMAAIGAPKWHSGIYHFSDEGAISWYDFTKSIHRLGGIEGCNVEPCLSDAYPTKATRPHYSVLDKSKIKATLGIAIPYWEDSLADCIRRIGAMADTHN